MFSRICYNVIYYLSDSQEIHNTMRMSQELTKHTIWLNRIRTEETESDDKCLVRQESKRRLDLLLNELKVSKVVK